MLLIVLLYDIFIKENAGFEDKRNINTDIYVTLDFFIDGPFSSFYCLLFTAFWNSAKGDSEYISLRICIILRNNLNLLNYETQIMNRH